ncbi:hypothetical protein FRB96_001184 [Tulasnella sp. 330]|nr:hypothetical protein FRB96_001184 [Tulasnella sp. 330]
MDDGPTQSLPTISVPRGIRRVYNTTVYQRNGLSPVKDGSDNHTMSILIRDANSTFLFDYAIISSFKATAANVSPASPGMIPSPSATIAVFVVIALVLFAVLYTGGRMIKMRSEERRGSSTSASTKPAEPPIPPDAYIIEPYAFHQEESADTSAPLSPNDAGNGRWQGESRRASLVSRYSTYPPYSHYLPLAHLDYSDLSETIGSSATTSASIGRRKWTFRVTNGSASPVATVSSTIPHMNEEPARERTLSSMSTSAPTLSSTTTVLSPQSHGSLKSFFRHPSLGPIPSLKTRRSIIDVIWPEIEAGTLTSITVPPVEGPTLVGTTS